jgi:thioesterase domain-containing protein
LEHPTIAGLAGRINKKGTASSDWKNMVPIRPHGQKTPLFCTHAGGGHVFFYNQLAKYVDPERPIYALQPSGLNGEGKMHQSIEEMASDYLEEIQAVHPNGVYHIVVYCFSTALGLEMAIQLERLEKKPNLIVVDTSAISYEYYNILGIKTRLYEFLKRFTNNPMVAVNKMIKKRVSKKIKPYMNKVIGDSNQKNIEIVRSNLMELYYNYQWKKFGWNITLLLTPKKDERFNRYVVDSWNKISINGITIIPLEGNHYNLFSEPDVKNTSDAIDLCMNNVENDIV